MPRARSLAVVVGLLLSGSVLRAAEPTRRTVSLNGTWELGEGALADTPPGVFDRRVPVPGLVASAEPPYPAVGVPSAQRQAFWYRRTFTAPAAGGTALLRVHKSQFGIKVWLNGQLLGTHLGAFTLAEFDALAAIRFGAENALLVRVGADRGQVPATVPIGTDLEKPTWTPGLWDDVTLVVTGAPHIATVKVEPDVAHATAVITTTVVNASAAPVSVDVSQVVRAWRPPACCVGPRCPARDGAECRLETRATCRRAVGRDSRRGRLRCTKMGRALAAACAGEGTCEAAARADALRCARRVGEVLTAELSRCFALRSGRGRSGPVVDTLEIAAGAEGRLTQRVPIENLRLWWPSDPFLYVVRTTVRENGAARDDLDTRFGMREVEWRAGEGKGLYVNGELTYLRGSNLSLHRFFEDRKRGTLPWDRAWVRQLLTANPRALHWNSFRVSIGRLPNFWYDIADEEGLLLADEFMMWNLGQPNFEMWSVDEMEREFTAWIRESWNHPSIAWWDAANETISAKTGQVIARVRGLDPTRQWENGGYNLPQGPADPIEDHPYLELQGDIRELPTWESQPPSIAGTASAPGHAYILNEYGWLWLTRDGRPEPFTAANYARLLGPGPFPPAVYRETAAYLIAGLTEFWRAHRGYAGVQNFTYLAKADPEFVSSDYFVDVERLVLEPRWLEYGESAFAPVAVFIYAWEGPFPADATSEIPLIVWNDTPRPQPATVQLFAVLPDGQVASRSALRFMDLAALGTARVGLPIRTPEETRYVLFARLRPVSSREPEVWSRRKIGYASVGDAIPDPPVEP